MNNETVPPAPQTHRGKAHSVAEFVVETDIYLTRRRKAHFIQDGHGGELYKAYNIGDVFAWLLDIGAKSAVMIDGENSYAVTFERLSSDHTPTKGPDNG